MEAIAELSGIAIRSDIEGQGDKIGVLVEDHMKYRGQINPEDRIELEAEITELRLGSKIGLAKSTVTSRKNGKVVAHGEIAFALIDNPQETPTQ
jgi:3-hydroxyacyl-[acyl-carrier-protein] dehydratase